MKTDYKKSVQNRKNPAQSEINKNIGTFNLTVIVEEDKDTLSLFKHVPGLIAFICTLKKGNNVLGIGRGTATLNRMSKYVDRAVCYAYNASLIDSIVRSTKTLDALYLQETSQKETGVSIEKPDLEGRDEQTFYGDEDMPSYATDKQKIFAKKLLTKCNDSKRSEYENKLSSPYLSKFDCSQIINSLLKKN